MDIILICIVALLSSLLTFFSGFGLGTILLPAFAAFFPLPQAIAMTAIVHFANNIFKGGLVFKKADWSVVWRFGLFSIPAAFIGAFLLNYSSDIPPAATYVFMGKTIEVTWQGIMIGLLMIFFAVYEVFPFLEEKIRPGENLWLGGIISGFLGGFSGHQGALRSAWLIRLFKDKVAYVATGTMIAIFVDLARLGVYSKHFAQMEIYSQWEYLVYPVLSAFVGAYAGNILLKKITIHFLKILVGILLVVIGLLTLSGILVKS